MKSTPLPILAAAGMALSLLGGCATTSLSKSQLASIDSVSVSAVVTADEAYQEPNARKGTNAANVGGMAGGFIGSLVGSAIDAGVTSSQQGKFREEYGETFEALEGMVPADLAARVQLSLVHAIRRDEFFGEKLTEDGQTQFKTTLVAYGLRRAGDATADNMLMQFFLTVELRLENREKGKLFAETVTGASTFGRLPSEYLEDPFLFEEAVTQATENLGVSVELRLDSRIGRFR